MSQALVLSPRVSPQSSGRHSSTPAGSLIVGLHKSLTFLHNEARPICRAAMWSLVTRPPPSSIAFSLSRPLVTLSAPLPSFFSPLLLLHFPPPPTLYPRDL
ncbi:hypothetical protein Pmani_018059 [Petrolisthes manimaculis]|uniref:Uncharacterized protein n=1 Tax=Petrolisthes manimaculis TaxID=1843537 RepID=A0AAE1U583_9EUCA|nr:hypothetical protein Pmani_018059 [Petrolisthes manimaculis]